MKRAAIVLLVLGMVSACGRGAESLQAAGVAAGPTESQPVSAGPGPEGGVPAPPGAIAAGQIAVALEGDVRHLGDTRYEAAGPELKCSAMLLPDDGGPAQPATSLVDWKVDPAGAGTFSIGAQGAYFLPAAAGVATIYAELPGERGPRRSPGLSLAVSSPGPAPAE